MNELFRSLIDCLKQETDHYRKLAVLAEKQKDLLVAGKVDSIQENTRLEEKEVFALGPLAGKRNDLLAQLAKAHQEKQMSLEEALKKCPPEAVEDFKKAVLELVRAAKGLDQINQINGKLLGNALTFTNFTLRLISNGGQKKAFSPSGKTEENKPSFVNRVI